MALTDELQQKIDNLKKSQKRIEKNLKMSKENLNDTIDASIKKVMSEEDFINNEDYKKYFESKHPSTSPSAPITIDDSEINSWIGKLSKTEKIDLIAEYSKYDEYEKGKNDWEADLKDAQEAKDFTKKAIAKQATEVIKEFRNLIKENEKVIADLEEKIAKKENQLYEIDRQLERLSTEVTDKNGKKIINTDKAVEANTKRRDELANEIDDLKEQLTSIKNEHSEYKRKIEKQISKIEESLKKEKIYVGSYEGLGNSRSDANTNENSNSQVAGTGYVQNGDNTRKPKDIAKAMMVDFDNLAPSEIIEMIEQIGYEDLLDMSRNLGPINRTKLKVEMENILANKKDDNVISKDSVKISTDNLKNLNNLTDEQFNLIIETMQNYTNNFKNMKVHERKAAESIMEYLKISVLLTESHTNAVRRAFRKLSHKGKRIEDMGAELARFANEKGEVEAFKWKKNQSIRDILKVKTPISPMGRKKNSDRSGTKPIQRDR